MRRALLRTVLSIGIVLSLGNSMCRARSDTHTDDEPDDGRTNVPIVIAVFVPGVGPLFLPGFRIAGR